MQAQETGSAIEGAAEAAGQAIAAMIEALC